MVEAHQQCGAASAQTLDDHHLPQRTGAIERIGREQRREIEQVAFVAGRRQREPAEVIREIEVGVLNPRGRLQGERGLHPLAQPGHDPRGPQHALGEALHVGG